ncbi:MAG: ATP-dependent DNA helicase [Methanomicrobiales archaeon]|nr:ATP-dependent DNA helicase [Methanomicrobiales archaeon]
MDHLDEWFPYDDYRPNQRQMLEVVAASAKQGGIVMIDAPTGSGKSSAVAALLSERGSRKVIIAVRTISQLTTFIRELSMIKKKKPLLKFSFLVGKSNLCPLGGEGDVYRRCEGVKGLTTSLMRERAEQGSLVPATDPVIKKQVAQIDRDHPMICPYFINSRIYMRADGGALKMVPSPNLRLKADRVQLPGVQPQQVTELCGEICPYETMLYAAQKSDVIVLNYYHLFDDMVREQLYQLIGVEPSDVLLLIDEAHNCGEVLQDVQSVRIEEQFLEQASHELLHLKKTVKGVEAVHHLIPRIKDYMQGLKSSLENEDWFDPVIFERIILKGSLYGSLSEIVEELMTISERIRESNIRAGEFKETAIERLNAFMFRLEQSASDTSYLTVYKKEEDEIFLEVRNIDPGAKMRDLAGSHYSCTMISGTLSPVTSYKKYYFGDTDVTLCSLPNSFPKKNRRIICARDITTSFSQRQDKGNTQNIVDYIKLFTTLPGNLAVYFPSYQILDQYAARVVSGISKKKVFIEPKDAKDANIALNEFMALPSMKKSGVIFAVCGGKWSEGLDYRGDMLSGALVIGLPLAPFNHPRKMIIDYFRHKFGEEGEFICYTLPAINRAQQALGRVIRTPEDRGVLVFGEKRFLEAKVIRGLPAWIREELRECDLPEFRDMMSQWK